MTSTAGRSASTITPPVHSLRPRGVHGRPARIEPARCGCDGAEGPGENHADRMKPLCALLALASLASPVAAQEAKGALAGLAAYEGADRHQRLLEGARREGFLSLTRECEQCAQGFHAVG